ncbi:MAG TPA: YfbK domain-containing protein [Lacunisphaera sp.]|nr:YfbK domain-containing protein [Lacunisphaera sp.]
MAAARAPASVAPALLERHKAALRSYVQALSRGDAARQEPIVEAVWQDAHAAENAEFEDDPTVWLFANARRRVLGAGQRDVLSDEAGGNAADDEAGPEGEEPRVVVHRTIGSLTAKQQEALRLKFQFHLDLQEIATITGQAKSGIGWLLHQAVARIGQALGRRDDDDSSLAHDPRVTAYALDEMDPSERKFFEKGVVNGKALLEREKAIRTWAGHITAVLSSGAPVARRRKRKRAAAWWKSRALWAGLVLVFLAGLFLAYRGRSAAHPGRPDPNRVAPSRGEATRSEDDVTSSDRVAPSDAGEAAPVHGIFQGAQETRPIVARSVASPPAAVPDGRAQGTAEAGRGTLKPAGAADPDEDFFRAGKDRTKPSAPAGSDLPGERPAATAPLRTDTGALFARKPVAEPAGARDGEARGEIEIVGDQPGKGKPAEDIAVIPAMGGLPRQLAAKQWPKREQVRLAEMLKNTPKANGPMSHPIETHVELMRSPWDGRKQVARVSFRAKDAPAPARGAANIVFAIDVSQSMVGPNRLPLVQEGVRRLVDRLRPDDRISVVTYAEKSELALEAAPAAQAAELRECLGGLEAAGRTNGSEGLRLAYATVHRHWIEGGMNVVVLCTDGNFNLGTTDESALAALAAAQAAKGVQLSVFGFGRTDRNDLRLEVLARNGGGRSCYVNTEEEAERQLVEQIDGLFAPVAREVRLEVEFNDAAVADHRRIGDGPDKDTKAEVAALLPGRSVTALFEVTPRQPSGTGGLGRLDLAYVLPETGERKVETLELAPAEQGAAKTAVEFKFAVAMAEFGRILRAGRPKDTVDLDRLDDWVRANLANDAGGYRTELLENLALARTLVRSEAGRNP